MTCTKQSLTHYEGTYINIITDLTHVIHNVTGDFKIIATAL